MIWTLAIFWAQVAWAACDEPVSARELGDAAVRAEQAWADMDREGFLEQAGRVEAMLPCVEDALYPDQVASYFRVRGMQAFFTGDRNAALQAWQSALALQPDYELSADLAGPDHPLRSVIDEAATLATGWRELETPVDGWLQVDGASSNRLPIHRPSVFQRFGEDGRLIATVRVDPPGHPPPYEAVWVPSKDGVVTDLRVRRLRRAQDIARAMTWAGPVVGVMGAISLFGRDSTPGTVAVGVGLAGTVGGIPLANIANAQERRLLAQYDLAPGAAMGAVSWGFYGATAAALVASPLVPTLAVAAIPCWLCAAIASSVAIGENRRAAKVEVPWRARARVAVLPAQQGARVALVVHGW